MKYLETAQYVQTVLLKQYLDTVAPPPQHCSGNRESSPIRRIQLFPRNSALSQDSSPMSGIQLFPRNSALSQESCQESSPVPGIQPYPRNSALPQDSCQESIPGIRPSSGKPTVSQESSPDTESRVGIQKQFLNAAEILGFWKSNCHKVILYKNSKIISKKCVYVCFT
jgi:hypothetical protein